MRLYIVAGVLLLAGFANVARGLDHTGSDYRPWALNNGSYSDIVAMGGDRYADGDRPRPYVDDRIEYPVVIGVLLWLPSYAPGGAAGRLAVSTAVLGAFLMWTLAMLRRIPGANPWLLAATPALALYGVLNWDLAGIAMLIGAFAYASRPGASGALAGLGITTKLFPIVAVAALWRTIRERRRWLTATAIVLITVNVPVAIAAFDNWSHFFRFSSKRPPDFSIWNALSITSVPVINVISIAAVGAAALVAMRYARTPMGARYAVGGILAVWLATNKVSSPQFCLWLFAAAALMSAPWWLFAALVAVSTFDFVCELWLYSRHLLALHPVVAVMVWTRTAVVVVYAWWCWRRLWIEVAGDEVSQRSSGVHGDGAGVADGLNLAR